MSDPNFSLNFQSTRAMASKSGDMVYSQGTYTMTATNPKTKKPVTDHGKYLTVYTKQADGSWKAVADTFNSDSTM
jgi:ketosteroid isomerase-like protein